jgi:hypothetical protein
MLCQPFPRRAALVVQAAALASGGATPERDRPDVALLALEPRFQAAWNAYEEAVAPIHAYRASVGDQLAPLPAHLCAQASIAHDLEDAAWSLYDAATDMTPTTLEGLAALARVAATMERGEDGTPDGDGRLCRATMAVLQAVMRLAPSA